MKEGEGRVKFLFLRDSSLSRLETITQIVCLYSATAREE